MEYSKEFKSYENQADLLISRNLICDKNHLISLLKRINYYRLTGYLYPYKNSDETYENCNLDEIETIILLDEKLSRILYAMLKEFEIGIKTRIIHHYTKQYGPFGYINRSNMPGLTDVKHGTLLAEVTSQTEKCQENFVQHFQSKYGDCHEYLPMWMAFEISTLGTVVRFYEGMDKRMKAELAHEFHTFDTVLTSWLSSIWELRNIVSHHGRLWRRNMGFKPKIPKKTKKWNQPVRINNNRLFGIITVLYYMCNHLSSNNHYYSDFVELDSESNYLEGYGFPENWKESEIWKMR